ncbi:MAG: glycosyltransferase family 2 protein [Clostridia bacterium]|nr:glycosyltransferase family 2 protein [Clostridia bacterium]
MNLCKRNKFIYYSLKAVKVLFTRGPIVVVQLTKKKMRTKSVGGKFSISAKRRKAEEAATFTSDVKFSVLVPLYNTPIKFLRQMIESVQKQTYKNWELCLADGSDADHSDVEAVVKELQKADERIKYVKLEKNLGISLNTNACIDISSGNYIALFDHDDLLHPSALFKVAKRIEETGADFIYTDEATFTGNNPRNVVTAHFKADFAPDTLRSYNYICHLSVFSRELMNKVGVFRAECDGSQDYDMILRLTEQATKIEHIPELLYYWRGHKNSTAQDIGSKPYIIAAAHRALSDHLKRIGLRGSVLDGTLPSTYRMSYELKDEPLISIIIANKDNVDSLDKCLRSIYEKSSYQNFEVIIVENNSERKETFEYYKLIQEEYPSCKVIKWTEGFNYSAINNFGCQHAKGEYFMLLNNDVEIISPQWLEEMLMFAQRSDVGAVGAMLYYPDDTIQHAGVILGIGGVAGHGHKHTPRGGFGYMSRATIAQNYTAVTFACVLIPKSVYNQVGGLDVGYQVAFNDVDMCMRIREAGYLIVFTPYAELYHYESKSRGSEDTPEKVLRFQSEVYRFQERWGKELEAGDPYYNPNLTLAYEDFSVKMEK